MTRAVGVEAVPGYLSARLLLVELRVRRAVAELSASDPVPDDPMRGMRITPEWVAWLLERRASAVEPDQVDAEAFAIAERWADRAEAAGQRVRPRQLARDFSLSQLDVELLLVALLPDLDARYEKLYGYLNDDVTRRRATIGLALRLCGVAPAAGTGRARFAAPAPLVSGGLLLVEEAERPLLTRSLRVPDRVTAHLLGDDTPDARLTALLQPVGGPRGGAPSGVAGTLRAALDTGVTLGYLRQPPGAHARGLAEAALGDAGRPLLALDLGALARDHNPREALATLAREARLRGASLVAGPVDALNPATDAEGALALRRLAAIGVPTLLTGAIRWDPLWSERGPLLVSAEPLTVAERVTLWRSVPGESRRPIPLAGDVDLARELAPYTLRADQVREAAAAAGRLALLDGADHVDAGHVRAGVRQQNAAGLERLARRVEPAVGWDDLVLPGQTRDRLDDLVRRVRHRERVLGGWRLRPGGGRGRGVTALFSGDSGTGKTMSAEVVAAELGLDLYVVDLSTVVDKYVGQTEKNLERIFTEATLVNGVLLFDEADAIFGKRSEVSDAHDRYANIESAYLLQRMESFDGVAILTTNLRANLDEAFTRRLDVIVEFPTPDEKRRAALWDRCLGRRLPRSPDLDLEFCARAFELTGGGIRACALTAGYLAADDGGVVTMAHLVAAARHEYRKLGRLVLGGEFTQDLGGHRVPA